MLAKPKPAYLALANTFGTLGYFSTITQWLWSIVVVGYPLLSQGKLAMFLPDARNTPAPHPVEYGAFTPVMTAVAIGFTIAIVVITVYLLIRLPATVGKRGSTVTHQAAAALAPIVSKKPLGKKQRRALTYRLTWWVKACLVLIPAAAIFFASPETGLDTSVMVAVGVFCAGCSTLYFILQWCIARVFGIAAEALW